MYYQPWIADEGWEDRDPKLKLLKDLPTRFSHTSDLAGRVAVEPWGIVLIRGPRQIGKSTFLREFAVKCLREARLPPQRVVLFDVERFEDRHALLGELEGFLREADGFSVILLDELTSLPQWWLAVKILADSGMLQQSLIVGTGSSTIDLAQGGDLLPGRRGARYPVDFELLPVPYRMVAEKMSPEEYLLTGGCPWAMNEYLRRRFIPAHVYEVYASWIRGCFEKRRHTMQHLPNLLHALAAHQGSPISMQKLSRDCGIGSNNTGENYVDLLERIYAVIPAYWVPPSGTPPAPRKNRKFYPIDPFLHHVFADIDKGWDSAFAASVARRDDPATCGLLVEGLVAAELRRRYGTSRLGYWQGKTEIDFVTPDHCFEVKYQNHVSISEFAWVKAILSRNQQFTVITKRDNARDEGIRLVDLRAWLTEGCSVQD